MRNSIASNRRDHFLVNFLPGLLLFIFIGSGIGLLVLVAVADKPTTPSAIEFGPNSVRGIFGAYLLALIFGFLPGMAAYVIYFALCVGASFRLRPKLRDSRLRLWGALFGTIAGFAAAAMTGYVSPPLNLAIPTLPAAICGWLHGVSMLRTPELSGSA